MVNWLRKEYGESVPIVITENGVSDRIGNLDDMQRIYFFKHYLNQLLKGKRGEETSSKSSICWATAWSSRKKRAKKQDFKAETKM